MSQPPTPRVKLPEVIPRKPVVPGPNSWALSATQGDPKKLPQPAQVTNREKYEKKPMPLTPEKASNDDRLAVKKHRGYIQPATPLVYSNQNIQSQKQRAATDPIVPHPLFTGRPGGIAQIRKNFSTSKTNVNTLQEDDVAKLPSASPVVSEKALQLLGVWPIRDNSRHPPPASAPPSTSTPEPYHMSSDDHSERSISPARQIQSTPVPTCRHARENDTPTPELRRVSLATTAETFEDEEVPQQSFGNPEDMVMGDGTLNPTRTGTYGGVGGAEYVDGHENQRIASYAGVIEDTEPVDQTSPTRNSSSFQQYDSEGPLPPRVYSPSNYDGVWENDPHVGYSLPPFSPERPYHRQQPEMQMRDSSQGSGTTVPVVLRDYYLPQSRLSLYPPSKPSVNSWTHNSQAPLGNSFAATNPPPSASMRPQFAKPNMINAAPTPPRSHPDFQPSGPMPAALAQLELSLHHHIESCFGSLSRLVTDKYDRVMDQVIRRLENLEEMVGKGQKIGRGDIKDVKKDISSLKGEVKDVVKGSDAIKDLIKALDDKMDKLEKNFEENGCKYQHVAVDTNGSEPERPKTQQGATVRRGTGSANVSGNPEQPQPYQSGTSHSSSARHQSGHSSKERRSNTMSGGGQSSAPGSSRREYFAELEAARGPVPDINEHPAFTGVRQGYEHAYDPNGMLVGLGGSDAAAFQAPFFNDGWYQRVYGK